MKQDIEQIIKTGEVFEDIHFLPNIDSIICKDKKDPSYQKTPLNYLEEYKTYKWLKSSEIYPNPSIFLQNIKPTDINQGSIGNCYLLVALMGLCEYPNRIYRIIVTQLVNDSRVYAVKLLIQGEIKIIVIDDYFPCKTDNKPSFSTTRESELWMLLIEKAWSKVNGRCYMKTWLGIPNEALFSVTEAPTIYENHKKYIDHRKIYYIWDKIREGFKRKWVICANTEEVDGSEMNGLVINHAYSVIGCYEKDIELVNNSRTFINKMKKKYPYFKDNSIKLVKIRNPWGCQEWKGDFSSDSKYWSLKLKEKVNYEKKIEGVFYMTFEDFTHFFPWSFFCKIEDDYYYRYGKYNQNLQEKLSFKIVQKYHEKKVKNAHSNLNDKSSKNSSQSQIKVIKTVKSAEEGNDDSLISQYNYFEREKEINLYAFSTFFLEIPRLTKLCLCLHQPQKRFLDFSKLNGISHDYSIPIGQIIIIKTDDNISKFITGDFINWENINLELELEPGEYHIFCRSFWNFPFKCKLVISTYADIPLDIYQSTKYSISDKPEYNIYKDRNLGKIDNWLTNVMKQIALKIEPKEKISDYEFNSYFVNDIFDNSIGFGVFYYENNSTKGVLNAIINFNVLHGARVLNLEPNSDGYYIIKVKPLDSFVLILELYELPWDSTISWTHFKWFEYSVDYYVKTFLEDQKTTKKENYEYDNIVYSEIKHQKGYVIHLENKSKSNYKCNLKFTELVNMKVEDKNFVSDENNFETILKMKSSYYFNIDWIKKTEDCSFKIKKSFEKI